MRAVKENDLLKLGLNSVECRVLHRVFGELLRNYAVAPEQMEAQAATAWYSKRGCTAAKMSAEETREWRAHLHGLKCANAVRIEEWRRQLARIPAGPCQLQLKFDEAPNLITVLNDHRLLAAACHGIGQGEMDLQTSSALDRLSLEQQSALYEIHFLAYAMEEILRLLLDDGMEHQDLPPPTT